MIRYTLIDFDASRRRAALRDESGSYHVAVIGSQAQEIGALIYGPRPSQGHSVLRCASSGRSVHVIFKATHCTQDDVLGRLHPA